jgi:hypothetical protein
VRYVLFHLYLYGDGRAELRDRLKAYSEYLRPLWVDEYMSLYEIAGSPPPSGDRR